MSTFNSKVKISADHNNIFDTKLKSYDGQHFLKNLKFVFQFSNFNAFFNGFDGFMQNIFAGFKLPTETCKTIL